MPRCRHEIAVLGVLMLGLAGCGSTQSVGKLSCPTPLVAPGLDAAADLRPGGSGPGDVRFGVKLTSVNSNCSTEKVGLSADVRIGFVVARADPKVTRADFAYFVAVADAQRNILTKKEYKVDVEFSPRLKQLNVSDQVTVGEGGHVPRTGRAPEKVTGSPLPVTLERQLQKFAIARRGPLDCGALGAE